MKAMLLLSIALFTAAAAAVAFRADEDRPVRHVVVFKFSADATSDQVAEITDAFRGLKDKVPGILSFEHGANMSPEGKDQGFTHVYTLTFENAAARDGYLPHPDHAAFGKLLRGSGIFEDVFVVDYVPEE